MSWPTFLTGSINYEDYKVGFLGFLGHDSVYRIA
jgi:hypothetical protein